MDVPLRFAAHPGHVIALAFCRDGQTLISSGVDGTIRLWSVPGWEPLATWQGHTRSVNCLSLSPDGNTLATGSTDATFRLRSFPEGQELHTLRDREKMVAAVQISADGGSLAAGWYGGRVTVWRLDGEPLLAMQANDGNVSAVAVTPDGRCLATGGLGDDIKIWSLPDGALFQTLAGHRTSVGVLAFLQRGCLLVSIGYEGTVRFWDTEMWEAVRVWEGVGRHLRSLAVSPDEATLALGLEGAVQLVSAGSGERRMKLAVGTPAVNGIAFSPDGRWLAAAAADGKIRVWEMA